MAHSSNDVFSLLEPMFPEVDTWTFPLQSSSTSQINDWLHQEDYLFTSAPPQPTVPQPDDAFTEFFPTFSGISASYIPENTNCYRNDFLVSPSSSQDITQWNTDHMPSPSTSYQAVSPFTTCNELTPPQKQVRIKVENSEKTNEVSPPSSYSGEYIPQWCPATSPSPSTSYNTMSPFTPVSQPQLSQKQTRIKLEDYKKETRYSPYSFYSQENSPRWYSSPSPSSFVYQGYHPFDSVHQQQSSSLEKIRTKKEESCSNCHTTSSTMWRWNLTTGDRECNACNLYEKKNGRPRPSSLWKKALLKRNRKPNA